MTCVFTLILLHAVFCDIRLIFYYSSTTWLRAFVSRILYWILYFSAESLCSVPLISPLSLTGDQALVITENLTSHFPGNGIGVMCGDIAAQGCWHSKHLLGSWGTDVLRPDNLLPHKPANASADIQYGIFPVLP